jgi:hypothetical protein
MIIGRVYLLFLQAQVLQGKVNIKLCNLSEQIRIILILKILIVYMVQMLI